jgi:hypothetical protein
MNSILPKLSVKKAAALLITHNVFWGLVQIYKGVEYIYSINITQNNLGFKSFLGVTIISMIIVIPLNIAQFFMSKDWSLWGNWPYIVSFIFVCLSYLVGFAVLILV